MRLTQQRPAPKPGVRARGFSLLEVLITLIVFSVGLLGLAAMLISAVKGNHQAYYRSQAVYVAEAMADGMRANLFGVNANAYNTDGFISVSPEEACTECEPMDIAARDLSIWAGIASDRLPGGEISIECTQASAPLGAAAASYDGICTLGVAWVETGDVGQAEQTNRTVFSWMVQP